MWAGIANGMFWLHTSHHVGPQTPLCRKLQLVVPGKNPVVILEFTQFEMHYVF